MKVKAILAIGLAALALDISAARKRRSRPGKDGLIYPNQYQDLFKSKIKKRQRKAKDATRVTWQDIAGAFNALVGNETDCPPENLQRGVAWIEQTTGLAMQALQIGVLSYIFQIQNKGLQPERFGLVLERARIKTNQLEDERKAFIVIYLDGITDSIKNMMRHIKQNNPEQAQSEQKRLTYYIEILEPYLTNSIYTDFFKKYRGMKDDYKQIIKDAKLYSTLDLSEPALNGACHE